MDDRWSNPAFSAQWA